MKPIKIDVSDTESLRQGLVKLAKKSKGGGLLSLEDDISAFDNDFLKKGIQLIIDGTDPELVKGILRTEITSYEDAGKMKIKEETLRMEKELAKDIRKKEMILEGILSIQTGDNPRIVDEKLKSFNPKM